MLDSAVRFLTTLVPPSRRGDELARRKSLLLVGILLLVTCSLPINMAYQLATGQWLLLVMSTATMAIFTILLAIGRTRDIHDIACQVMLMWGFAGVFGTAMLSGGLYSSVTPIATVLPLLALALRTRRTAAAWTAATAASIVLLGVLESLGLVPEGERAAFEQPFPFTVNLLLMLAYAAGFAWFLQSINQLRLEQLEQERQHADDANAAKSAFLANMSHELRTPMNGVLGLTEIVLLDEQLSAQHRDRLRTVLQSGRALVDLLNDILDLSRVEAGQLVLERIPWSPRRITRDVERLFGEVALRRGLVLEVDVTHKELPDWVLGDPTRVRQVLCNLVGNAVKFTDDGSVRICLSSDEQHLHFSVVDTGPGIAADVQARIFEPFTQADASTVRRHGGTGLGLTICRRLAHLMGGELGVESCLGEGSTFHVRLPYEATRAPHGWEEVPTGELTSRIVTVDPPFAAVDAAPTERPLATDGFGGIEVLVVEDEDVNRMVAEVMLEQLGCTVTTAVDGEAGLAEIFRKPVYDVVLMDRHMPGMDGLEVTRLVRLAGHRLPIVGLTASVRPEDRQQALNAGMDAFLGKPFTRAQLEAILTDVLGRSASSAPTTAPDERRPEPR